MLKEVEPIDIFNTDKKTEDEITESYVSALVFSIDVEEKTYNYYIELSENETDESIKSIFKKMAEYEKQHYDILKEELEYAKNAMI